MNKPIFILLLIFIVSCAKQGMPPGGPVDKTPPEVIRTIPAPGDTLVDPEIKVQVWFSEGINPKSAAEAVFITPYMDEDVEMKWRGKRIIIQFKKNLADNRTYVITFGTGIKDYRNNALEASYTLAFSTGPLLDKGVMSGQVFGIENAQGIGVWAYALNDSLTPDPTLHAPDYIVQCEQDGAFRFSNVSPGQYRLLAVLDRYADRLYQSVEDDFGLTTRDVLLTREAALEDSLFFRMTREDTLGPTLVRALATPGGRLMIRLDEPIVESDLSASSFTVVSEADSTDTLGIHSVYIDPMSPETLHAFTDAQRDSTVYRLILGPLTDVAGNRVDSQFASVNFQSNTDVDTTQPQIMRFEPTPNSTAVGLTTPIRMTFNEPMDTLLFPLAFSITDSLAQAVSGHLRWNAPSEMELQLHDSLMSRMTYVVTVAGDSAVDLAGNASMDTTFSFTTMNADTLSEIWGNVVDPDPLGAGSIHLTARQVGSAIEYTDILPQPGPYGLLGVLPGDYVLQVFRDRDGNNRYSHGRVHPFELSERFVVYRDTVAVRARWPNEGNDIQLK